MSDVTRPTQIERISGILNGADRTEKIRKSAELIDSLTPGVRRTYSSEEIWARDHKDNEFLFYMNRPHEEKVKLMLEGGMRNQYLGACLDYVRFGAMNACFWNFGGSKGLVKFVSEWMKMNKGNLIWADQPMPEDLTLPHIKYEGCPRDKEADGRLKHFGIVEDRAGRMRCAHVSKKLMRPSYMKEYTCTDKHAMLPRIEFYEEEPSKPIFDDLRYDEMEGFEEDFKEYKEKMKLFEAEKPIEVVDHCYSIISEPRDLVLPLEKIFSRLNIAESTMIRYCKDRDNCRKDRYSNMCFGHSVPNTHVGFPFCGWTLAWYVQKWYGQVSNGRAPLFMDKGREDFYQQFPNFRVFSSDD